MQETLSSYVDARTKALGLSQLELCRRAGISRQTLHSMLASTGRLPSLQSVMALAGGLRVHPIRLLQLICDDHVPSGLPEHAQALRGDQSAFVRDVSFADGEIVRPGQRFTKIWEMQNVGQVAWTDRYMHCMDEELVVQLRSGETLRMAQNLTPAVCRFPVPTTLPGETVQLSVEFTAPLIPGTVLSYWKSHHADGSLCFPGASGLWVKVQVLAMTPASVESRDRIRKLS